MPLSVDNIIQRNSGSFSGTTGSVTLPGAATAGNTVLAFMTWNAGAITFTGWTGDDTSTLTTPRSGIYRISDVTALSSWTVSFSATTICDWVIYEVAGLDLDNPLDVKAHTAGTGATLSPGLTSPSSTFDGVIFALHACYDATSATPGTWSGHTNGLVETQEVGGNDGAKSIGLSVSETYSMSLAAWTCTATKTAPVGQNSLANIAVYSAAGAHRAPDLAWFTGFQWGTAAGIATGPTNNFPIFSSAAGTPAIVSTNPRTGSYCLELSSTAAAEHLTKNAVSVGSATQQAVRFSIYFPTSLPGADVVLFASEVAAGNGAPCTVRFKSATSKLSIQVGSGTEVSSDATVAVNNWISVDYRIDGRLAGHVADWRIRYDDTAPTVYVDQTQATGTAVGAATGGWLQRIGWTASSTATVRYADVAVANVGAHYPLGDIKAVGLGVDPSVNVTLSGTSTNFQTFTANGTLAAWDATVAHNNIDEIPPVLGASADGFAQVAIASTNYIEIPMDRFDAADTYAAAIRGVRVYACGWAASATTCTLGLRIYDGVAELLLVPTSTATAFDNTATPAWMSPMIRGSARYDWTQTLLDALAVRVGYSTDATPAVGVHMVMIEVALRIGDLVRVGSGEDGAFTIDARIDPDSSAYIAIIVTTPPGTRGATVTWAILGVDQTPVYVPPDRVHTEVIAATDIATFTGFSLETDPA